uniref:Deubiquitinating enzyme MINDY-3/4 conserved domain-containing protein n=1 Tax=Prymnesium polylepis TaxID=72548 RepID=A0A7S4JNG4_9EUKA
MRPDGPGIILLLYSLVLTRGLAMVQRDADFPTPLIGTNGYCAQELVNLLLVGRAHSNVFDGEKTVGGDDGCGDGARLRGIPRKAPVGFLTLFERQGQAGHPLLVVGKNLKKPLAPVYVVQSESHYSCLWVEGPSPPDLSAADGEAAVGADDGEEEDEEEAAMEGGPDCAFDVSYFDQMAERDEAVRLTIRRRPPSVPVPECSTALPPLENVILTRWPGGEVDWNGEEIIL